jgi:hypothetical protein
MDCAVAHSFFSKPFSKMQTFALKVFTFAISRLFLAGEGLLAGSELAEQRAGGG